MADSSLNCMGACAVAQAAESSRTSFPGCISQQQQPAQQPGSLASAQMVECTPRPRMTNRQPKSSGDKPEMQAVGDEGAEGKHEVPGRCGA